MSRPNSAEITNLDVVTLQHIAEAEAQDAPTPPAFVDTLLRLSKCGYIEGDGNCKIRTTPAGRNILSDSIGTRLHH